MATIRLREIPEDVYEVIRARARVSGRSIRSYLGDIVVDVASRPTTDEALAAMDDVRAASPSPGATRASVLEVLAELRR
ncbi:hypothetical protein [Pseudonocardia parietis]|uniref:Antitoxin n=1 Tax=Pseudonocardia parietis TaxID=570936 RepID=A0ABS4VPW7_9PSEU|nr:hypothetical protein [Pseudonocardia parietis]MBP2365968.1 hypothetical protein [Pseudonocardia parietis]